MKISIGQTGKVTRDVTDALSAHTLGNPGVNVLATSRTNCIELGNPLQPSVSFRDAAVGIPRIETNGATRVVTVCS